MKPESVVSQEVIRDAVAHGVVLQRNNSGQGKFIDENTGQETYVRFGLMNVSKEQNKRIKSSDYIGIWKPYGIFVAIEFKKEGWVYSGKVEREIAQLAYINWVIAQGGRAGFCTCMEDFVKILYRN